MCCFACGHVLYNWAPQNAPLEEHRLFSPESIHFDKGYNLDFFSQNIDIQVLKTSHFSLPKSGVLLVLYRPPCFGCQKVSGYPPLFKHGCFISPEFGACHCTTSCLQYILLSSLNKLTTMYRSVDKATNLLNVFSLSSSLKIVQTYISCKSMSVVLGSCAKPSPVG